MDQVFAWSRTAITKLEMHQKRIESKSWTTLLIVVTFSLKLRSVADTQRVLDSRGVFNLLASSIVASKDSISLRVVLGIDVPNASIDSVKKSEEIQRCKTAS